MARITWGNVGERFYETGTDRGVLYPTASSGVAWNGLVAVNESPTGGEAQPFYIDGIKYLNIAASEEFEASLEAFASPAEFDVCDGTVEMYPGLFITQQVRRSFGLSYRTLIGNDVDAQDHGYKIHLVYNALAAPATRSRTTVSDTPEPAKMSWAITTKPPVLSGRRPSSHLIIDSRSTPPTLLSEIESLLYGEEFVDPRLPTQQEIVALFGG